MEEMIVKVKGGVLRATPSMDPEYPGIDVEFIADNDNGENLSRPRILIERPVESGELRALIWDDKNSEDYTKEVIFDESEASEAESKASQATPVTNPLVKGSTGIKTEIEPAAITLHQAIVKTGYGFDIADKDWDWGTYFDCPATWDECNDYYDRCCLLFALNIKVEEIRQDWYSPCYVADFLWEHRDAFGKFFDEENREGYRPCDYSDIAPDEDTGFLEAYLEPFESLLIGNYSESDYKKLYFMLVSGVDPAPELDEILKDRSQDKQNKEQL